MNRLHGFAVCLFVWLLSAHLISCSPRIQNRTIMVPMRDGVNLATLVRFPDQQQEKHPAVLIRTPYGKERRIEEYQYLIASGYALVIQDVRGRFDSEGIFEPFIHEGRDGYDAIAWIAGQSWCDGNIGMIGASYNGWVQYAAAVEKPPCLKAIIPNVAPADLFFDQAYIQGVFAPSRLLWCAIIEAVASDREIFNQDWETMLNHIPVSELDSIAVGETLDYYQTWIRHNSKDAYWTQSAHRERLRNIDIPVFIQTGWFDGHLRSSTMAYRELSEAGNENVKLIIGPWGHTSKESSRHNGEFMGDAADDIDLQEQYVKWFDRWLKQIPNGIVNEPSVQLFELNADAWRQADAYPPPNTERRDLFLSSSSQPDLATSAGHLVFRGDRVEHRIDRYTYDPADVPLFSREMMERGGHDLIRELFLNRDDYLFYRTEALQEEMTILGPIEAHIHASTSAVDTDWYAALVILDGEDQFADLVSVGAVRARFRNSTERPELLDGGEVVRYRIEMDPYGVKLDEGQRLGLIVTSSLGYPFLSKNLNTGKNNQTTTNYATADQRIYHTKSHQSLISMHVVSNSAADLESATDAGLTP